MSKSIHGHEVMNMLVTAERSFDKDQLVAEVVKNFGEDAVFHTCSAEGLSAEGLIDFLIGKGKVVESDEGLTMAANSRCH